MEDIEQWLSTDVVSWPRPAQKQRLGHIPPPPPHQQRAHEEVTGHRGR